MIHRNRNELDALRSADKEIERVLFGDKIVWENRAVKLLGTGQEFNLMDYRRYSELTAGNFFYLDFDRAAGADAITNAQGQTGYLTLWGWMHKEYDPDAGLLKTASYLNTDNSYADAQDATVVLVPDLSKIELIGTNTEFNIKALYPNDYQRFTVNNFLLSIPNNSSYFFNHYRGAVGTWTVSGSVELEKTYNASTGKLICRVHRVANSNVPADNFDNYVGTTVYLTRKSL